MIKSRNKTSHTYYEETANEIFVDIIEKYHESFKIFQSSMNDLQIKDEEE